MTRINSRSKGIRGERDVIDLLQPIVIKCYTVCGLTHISILQRNTLQCDRGGSVGNADIAGLEFLSIEVKNCAILQLDTWWQQCETACRNNHKKQEAVLIYKAGRGKFRVRMLGTIGFSITETRCVVDIALVDFLLWFERRLMEWLTEQNDLKRAPSVPVLAPPTPSPAPVAIAPEAAPTFKEQMAQAVAWCKSKGYPVPRAGSVERAEMFNWWLNASLNEELSQ